MNTCPIYMLLIRPFYVLWNSGGVMLTEDSLINGGDAGFATAWAGIFRLRLSTSTRSLGWDQSGSC
jgi:hypothetical protein